MNKAMIIFTALAMGLLVSACNTMEGVGKDIKKGGENLERSAERNKHQKAQR